MKRSIVFLLLALLTGILPMGASVTNNPEHLVFGKVWMEGGCRELMVQALHIEVTNYGEEDFQGYWRVVDSNWDWCGVSHNRMVEVPAGETKDVLIKFLFYLPGHYDFMIVNLSYPDERAAPKNKIIEFEVDIDEYVIPDLKSSIQLDMIERTDGGNIIYGDLAHFRISGSATLTNEGENTIFGRLLEEGYDYQGNAEKSSGIGVYIESKNVPGLWFNAWVCSLGYGLKSGETVAKDFVYEFREAIEPDIEYTLIVQYMNDVIARIPFVAKQGTNTYWTADGHVKPLPVGADQVLKVPREALAVDMRGQYEMNTTFSIDPSDANPNCLYYLGFLDNVPRGFKSETNVIRDYEAKNLVVDTDYDFYCPMPFKAKSALLNYTPVSETMGPASPTMTKTMSGALVLPFDASQAALNDVNEARMAVDGFSGDNLKVYRFVGDEDDVMRFQPVTERWLKAYEPYLLSVKPSSLSFFAEDVTIPAIRQAVAPGNDYDFIGSTVAVAHADNVWQWNCDNHFFYQSETCELVRPFNAMMYGKSGRQADLLTVDFIDPVATMVNELRTDARDQLKAVYSLSGQRIGDKGLRPGLYIIGGRKVVVK